MSDGLMVELYPQMYPIYPHKGIGAKGMVKVILAL